jgi:hypothetical protein
MRAVRFDTFTEQLFVAINGWLIATALDRGLRERCQQFSD